MCLRLCLVRFWRVHHRSSDDLSILPRCFEALPLGSESDKQSQRETLRKYLSDVVKATEPTIDTDHLGLNMALSLYEDDI